MEEDFVKESDDKNKIYLSDTRYQNLSIPLEYFTLENAVTEKQFVELTPLEAHGDCDFGSLDYFDVIRQEPVKAD